MCVLAEAVCGEVTPGHYDESCWERFCKQHGETGAVAICVGIDFGAISNKTRLPDHAARSIV